MTVSSYIPIPVYPVSTAAPFTYRDGLTFLQTLEQHRDKINELIAYDELQATGYAAIINDANQAISQALETIEILTGNYDSQLTDMQAALDEQLASVNASLGDIDAAITQANSAVAISADLVNDFNTAVAGFEADLLAIADLDLRVTAAEELVDGFAGSLSGKMDKNTIFHNVKDYGAIGDGVTDDTIAIRAASTAAGKNGIVVFPDGKWLVTSKITLPTDQHWMGLGIDYKDYAFSTNYILTNITAPDGIAIECTYNTRLTNLAFRGSGSGTGLVLYGRVILDNILVTDYSTGIYCDNLWYGALYNINANRNTTAIDVNRAYNLNIYNPRIYALSGTNPSYGIVLKANVDVNIYGGAIEGFAAAISFPNLNNVHLGLYGVYFETADSVVPSGFAGAVCVDARYTVGTTIQAIGCYIYLNNIRYFIDAYGSDVVANIHGVGNYFKGGQDSSVGYQHNAYRWSNNSDAKMYLSGDSWQAVTNKTNSLYYTPTLLPCGNSIICPPNDSQNNGMPNNMVYSGGKNFTTGSGYDVLGQTATLPAMPTVDKSNTHKGAMMYYTPTNKPIVWNGAAWTYFDGSAVS